MKVLFQYVKMKESETLSEITERQLEKLYKRFPYFIRANVYFKMEQGNTDSIRSCEIELTGPGPILFAATTAANFENAMKETVSDLQRQLKKRKEIYKPHLNR